MNIDNETMVNNCALYSVDLFNNSFPTFSETQFFVFHQNIRSFNRNIDEFILFIKNLNILPDVIIFSETFFSESNFHDLHGYNGYHRYRSDKGGGGVSVYVLENYVSDYVLDMCYIDDSVEFCTVSVKVTENLNVKVVGFYRPPSANPVNFSQYLEENIVSSFRPSEIVFMGGDANIDLSINNNVTNQYMNILYSGGFLPVITLPTRVTDTSSTLIDHFWVTVGAHVLPGVLENSITDHKLIFLCMTVPRRVESTKKKKFRDHSNQNLVNFQESVHDYIRSDFSSYDNCTVEFRTKMFLDKLYLIYNNFCPIRTKVFPLKKIDKPWIDQDLINLSKMKYNLYRSYKAGQVTYSHYTKFRNNLTTITRRCKYNYVRQQFEIYKNDIKKTFKCMNNLMGCQSKREISEIKINDVIHVNEAEIANLFSEYFENVPINLRNQIPPCPIDDFKRFLGTSSVNQMEYDCASEDEVIKIIGSLENKSARLDSIPVFIYKNINEVIAPIICDLFNSSIMEGNFPEILKIAEILPIHKSGPRSNLNNYRPISLLSTLSKIFEKLMCTRLKNHLFFNNVLHDNQFGFRTNCSTSDAIAQFLDGCYDSLNCRKVTVSVFLDLSKAFDTLDHKILVQKLYHIGIRGALLEWFESYLKSRKQRVTIGAAKSNFKSMLSGVPQGSVLSPTLFLIYINDMCRATNILNFVHFADDSTVYLSGSDIDYVVNNLNAGLECVDHWLTANKLSLNIIKSKYMVIANKKTPETLNIRIRNNNLTKATELKFLGVHIDHKLTFKFHIDLLARKVSQSIGAIYRISSFLPYRCIRTLYYSLIQSRLTYGIVAWGGAAKVHMNKLQILQNRIKRLITSRNNNPDSQVAILNLTKLYAYFCTVKFFMSYQLGFHYHFIPIINNLLPNHSYSTRHRSNDLFNVPFYNLSRCQNSFVYNACNFWNQLPVTIRNLDSLNLFKNGCKKFLFSNEIVF